MKQPGAGGAGAMPMDRIRALDGLRGLASVLVLVFHYFLMQIRPVEGTTLATAARASVLTWTAIDCFFVLSGFLIGGILIDQRDSPNLLRVFYRRRFFRIVPVYALLLTLFAVAWLLLDHGRFRWLFEGGLPAWAYLTYLQNYVMASQATFGSHFLGVTWSLAVEEQFYLLFPLVVRWVSPRWLPAWMVLVIVLTPFFRAWVLATHPAQWFPCYLWTPCRWDALACGVLGAWAVRSPVLAPRLARATPLLAAAMLAIGALLATRSDADRIFSSAFMIHYGYTLVDLFYLAFLLILVLRPAGSLALAMSVRPLVFLGTISYALYLFHQAALGLVHGLVRNLPPILIDGRTALLALGSLALSIGLAWLSYRWLEEPLLRRGRTVPYARPQPPGTPEAEAA